MTKLARRRVKLNCAVIALDSKFFSPPDQCHILIIKLFNLHTQKYNYWQLSGLLPSTSHEGTLNSSEITHFSMQSYFTSSFTAHRHLFLHCFQYSSPEYDTAYACLFTQELLFFRWFTAPTAEHHDLEMIFPHFDYRSLIVEQESGRHPGLSCFSPPHVHPHPL